MLSKLKITGRSQASRFHICFEYRKLFGLPKIEGSELYHGIRARIFPNLQLSAALVGEKVSDLFMKSLLEKYGKYSITIIPKLFIYV